MLRRWLFSRCFDAGTQPQQLLRDRWPFGVGSPCFLSGVVVVLGEVVYMGVVVSSGRGDLLGVVISPGVLSAAVPRLQGLGASFRCKIFFGYKVLWVLRRLPTICHNQWADQLLGTS